MKITLLLCTLYCGLAFGTQVQAAKLYKWVDKNGVVSYQDTPPPKGSKILEESTTDIADGSAGPETPKEAVKVYTVENCSLCVRIIEHLKALNVPVLELPLENDREAQSIILERSNSLITPTIFVGDQIHQGGEIKSLEKVLLEQGYKIDQAQPANSENQQITPSSNLEEG